MSGVIKTQPVKAGVATSLGYTEDTLPVFIGASQLRTIRVHYKGGLAVVYLQFHDLAAQPTNGLVSALPPIPLIPGAVGGAYYESDTPCDFAVGCFAVISTTPDTLTRAGAGDAFLVATFGGN
jgi:hypothetical protein